MASKNTKDLDFINEKGDPLKSMQKGKKPGVVMNLLNDMDHGPKASVGEHVRAGNTGGAKRIISQRMAQHWMAKKPNLPEVKKMIEMFKDDGFAFSEEGQKILKEMKKRFDKAVKKADLGHAEEPELFKNFEELASSLAKWDGPNLKKKSDDWKVSRGPHANSQIHQHPSQGKVVQRGGEFHAVPHGKEYHVSTHASLAEAKAALKPKK